MAGVGIVAQTTEIATGAAKLAILQILAAANHRVKVREISVSFKGVANTAVPILVEVSVQGDAASGGDSLTVQKLNPSDSETVQTTALELIDGSVQPAETNVIFSEEVHPQGGYTWQAPFGGELIVPGGDRLGISVTAGASVSCVGRIMGEE